MKTTSNKLKEVLKKSLINRNEMKSITGGANRIIVKAPVIDWD